MYIVPIAWLYVAFMMAVAEATNATGSVLGAVVTFVLYGVLPVILVVYLMGTPERKRKIKARERAQWEEAQQTASSRGTADNLTPVGSSANPDAGRHAAAAAQNGSVPPV